jgi:hypothetical protein
MRLVNWIKEKKMGKVETTGWADFRVELGIENR